MAKTTKALPSRSGAKKKPAARKPTRASSSQKATLNEPPIHLLDYFITIFGQKGIGKTSLVSQMPGIQVCQFEPRRRNLRNLQRSFLYLPVTELKKRKLDQTPWQDFKDFVEAGIADPKIQGFALDTIDRCYDSCLFHICHNIGVSDPGAMNDYGATWRAVCDEFEATLNSILYAEKALIVTSHATWKEVQTDTGADYEQLMPTAKKQPTDYIKAAADIVLYYGYHGRDRSMTVRGAQHCWTSCGTPENFFTKSGEPIQDFLCGNGPATAWATLQDAFHNKLTEACIPDEEEDEE